MSTLANILIKRDGITRTEAETIVEECRAMVMAGEDPEEILYEELGLEPDYVFDLLPQFI